MGALESQRTDDGYTTQVVVFVAALDDDGGTSDITPTPLTFASKGRPKDKDWATFETTLHMRRRTNQIAVAVYDVIGDNVLARTVDIE